MQSSKCLVAVWVVVCALSVRGEDTEIQRKAREALEKLQSQPAQPAAAPSQVQPTQTTQPAPKKSKQAKQPPANTAAPTAAAPAVPPSQLNAPPAADEASIAKAREALHEKMNSLQSGTTEAQSAPVPKISQPSPTPAPPAPVPAAAPAAAVAATAAPAATSAPPPAPVPATPDLPQTSDDANIAKAREALRQKMNELQSQPAPVTPAPVAPPAAVAATSAPAPTSAIQPPATPDLNAPPEADPAAIAKARDAMRQRMQSLPPEGAQAPEMVSSKAPRTTRTSLNFPPMASPALGISSAKEQRLQELLQQYKADLISPEQYHAARAKVLAEP